MPINPTFWELDRITGLPSSTMPPKKAVAKGLTFKCKSFDADTVRQLAKAGFFSYNDLNQFANSADKIRHEHSEFMAYKRTSLISGLRKIFLEAEFVRDVNEWAGMNDEEDDWHNEDIGEPRYFVTYRLLLNSSSIH